MIGVAAVAGLMVAGTWGVDEGEIVKITTLDDQGHDHVTEVWIVDLPSGRYLRSGRADNGWLQRVRARGELVLERGEASGSCRVELVTSPERTAEVASAMAEKYGFSDRIWDALADRSSQVAIRLASCDGALAAP